MEKVRFMKYYPRSQDDEVKTNNVWLKGHTDFGTITVLYSQPVAALQILTRDGKWKWIKHIENALVINVGDALEFLSGGYYKATIHRVVQPPSDQQNCTRLGLFYFCMTDDDVKLVPFAESPVLKRWRPLGVSGEGEEPAGLAASSAMLPTTPQRPEPLGPGQRGVGEKLDITGALQDSIDTYGLEDFSDDFLLELDRAEEAFPSSFCAPPPSSAAPTDMDDELTDDEFDSMFTEPCSQEVAAALDEMEQPDFVPSQCRSALQPTSLNFSSSVVKLEQLETTRPAPSVGIPNCQQKTPSFGVARGLASNSSQCPTRMPSIKVKEEGLPLAVASSRLSKYAYGPISSRVAAGAGSSSALFPSLRNNGEPSQSAAPKCTSPDLKLKAAPTRSSPCVNGRSHKHDISSFRTKRVSASDENSCPALLPRITIKTERTPMNNLSSLPIPARLLASGSGPASPPVAIKVEPPSPPPQTVNSKRKWTPSPDTDPDSEEDETPSKKLKPPPPSQPHLVEFFAAYPKFEYDPAGPSSQQFNQLREVYDLRRGRPGADMAYRGFTRAMGLSFTELYGDDVNSLESWHKLCRAVEIEPVPDCIEDCRRAIDELHVNLVDLVDTHNTCARVHRSPSEWDLSAYTVATKKFFPRTLDFNSSLLRYLLRQIFDPPPANLARQGNT